MNASRGFARILVCAMLGIAGGNASALQGWINKGAGSMNDTANWSARVLPLTTQSSANSAWCFWYAHTNPTTMTLSEDLVTDRMVIDADKSGAEAPCHHERAVGRHHCAANHRAGVGRRAFGGQVEVDHVAYAAFHRLEQEHRKRT